MMHKNFPIHLQLYKSNKSEIVNLSIEDDLSYSLLVRFERKKCFRYALIESPVYNDEGILDDPLIEGKILIKLIEVLKDRKTHFILAKGATVLFHSHPSKAKSVHFGTYEIDLARSEDELFASLHVKHRNVVRKAEKTGVVICDLTERIHEVYDVYAASQSRTANHTVSRDDFIKTVERLDGHVIVKGAVFKGEIQGIVIIPWSTPIALYLWGGSISTPKLGSMNLLQWQIIKELKSLGCKKYDMVGARINPEKGSKFESIQRFKKRFGGNLREGYLWKCSLNPFMYRLFVSYRIIVSLRKGRRYKGDVIDEEIKRGNRVNP